MTPLRQALTENLPLKTKKQQKDFLSILKNTFPEVITKGSDIVIGDRDAAKIVLSVRYDRSIKGTCVLCDLLQTLNSTTRSKALFVFTNKKGIPSFSTDKLLFILDSIDTGDIIQVAATAAAKANYGAAIKASFRPTKTKSIRFVTARRLPRSSAPIVYLSTKQKRAFFVFHRPKPQASDFSNVKPTCENILRLLFHLGI